MEILGNVSVCKGHTPTRLRSTVRYRRVDTPWINVRTQSIWEDDHPFLFYQPPWQIAFNRTLHFMENKRKLMADRTKMPKDVLTFLLLCSYTLPQKNKKTNTQKMFSNKKRDTCISIRENNQKHVLQASTADHGQLNIKCFWHSKTNKKRWSCHKADSQYICFHFA